MLAILVDQINSRSLYTFDIVLGKLLGLPYTCFEKKADFLSAPYFKLNYSTEQIDGIPSIHPHSLLFNRDIFKQEIKVETFAQTPVFFTQSSNEHHLLPFDVFACCFYLLSRYEEYLPHQADNLGRFQPQESLASQNGFLNKAIVHRWANILADALKEIYPEIIYSKPTFSFLPTLDIDNTYAYHGKGFFRSIAGFCRDVLRMDASAVLNRLKALRRAEADPYNSYAFIRKIHQEFGCKPLIFWLLGDYAKLDKNLPYSSRPMRKLIKESTLYSIAAIHPSSEAEKAKKIEIEKARLEEITGMKTNQSRMHYLKFRLPDTFEYLSQSGIANDYSMGYSELPGFRAGMAIPFPFFNLQTNRTTELMIHPFQIMDASFLYHKRKTPSEAMVEIKQMIDEVRLVGGQLITVFHNESLGESLHFKGWRESYRQMLEYIYKN